MINRILLIAAFLFATPAIADSIFFFHWGPTRDNADVLHWSGFPFDGDHGAKLNERGSVDLGSGYFHFARTHFNENGSIVGPAFYVARDPFSSMSYGKTNPDLIIVEIQANGDPNRFGRPTAVSNRDIFEDARKNPEKFDHYQLFGTYQGNSGGSIRPDWAGIYREPNAEERAQGVRVLIRPPEAHDVDRVWDGLTHGNAEDKLNFLGKLSQYLTIPYTASSRILFDRMFFDIGYEFLRDHLAHSTDGARFRSDVIDSLITFIRKMPESEKTRNLLGAWAQAGGPIAESDLLFLRQSPRRLDMVLERLTSEDRDRVVSDMLDRLVPMLEAEQETAFFVTEALGPSILTSAAKAQFIDRLRPYAYSFGVNEKLGHFDSAFTREVASLVPRNKFTEQWMAGEVGKYLENDGVNAMGAKVRKYLIAGRDAGLSSNDLIDALIVQIDRNPGIGQSLNFRLRKVISGIMYSEDLPTADRLAMYARLREHYRTHFLKDPTPITYLTPDFADSDKGAPILGEVLDAIPELKAKAILDLDEMGFERTTHRPQFTALLRALKCESLLEPKP